MATVDVSRLTPGDDIRGEDEEETSSLRRMLEAATAYLERHDWCPRLHERYLGLGIGGVLGVFLFRLDPPVGGKDEWLWVVEGDLPSAYFVIDNAPNPGAALRVYCTLMDEWVRAVLEGRPLDDVFPVDALPTQEHAEMLRSRVRFIRDRIIPWYREKAEEPR